MIGTWRHRRTGKTYVVVKLVRGKVLRIGFSERAWVDCVEYTSVESGGQSFIRELPDFTQAFDPVSVQPSSGDAEIETEEEPTMEVEIRSHSMEIEDVGDS